MTVHGLNLSIYSCSISAAFSCTNTIFLLGASASFGTSSFPSELNNCIPAIVKADVLLHVKLCIVC